MPVSVTPLRRIGAPWLALAAMASAAVAWLGLYGFGWNDYDSEARAAVDALVGGNLRGFFELAPVYGGSLLERAPFALAPSLWGGGELAIYRMLALPCLLAAAALGLWLVADIGARADGRSDRRTEDGARADGRTDRRTEDGARADGRSDRRTEDGARADGRSDRRAGGGTRLARAVALGLCVANPLTLAALEIGHPEELIGGVLCVAAVLLAARGRWAWAALALGAAIANKQWAVLAIAPVLVALPGRRVACMALAGSLSLALMAPFALLGGSSFSSNLSGAATPSSTIFQPWQVWWFFGHHGHVVRGLFGAIKPGYRTAPGWLDGVPHLLIPALAAALSIPVLLRRRTAGATVASTRAGGAQDRAMQDASGRPTGAVAPGAPRGAARRRESDALLLLALLLLLRCMLDTWDVVYYPLPFVLALLAWETSVGVRPALLALTSAVAVWAGCRWLPGVASADAQAAFFIAWTVPLAAWLAWRLYLPEASAPALGSQRAPRLPARRERAGAALAA